jgi:beta-glucanase (GH16 family)
MTIIFEDSFSKDGYIDETKWHFNIWKGGGSYYGRTQQRQFLPHAKGGVMTLWLDTYNGGDGKSFLGSEAISYELFDLSKGPIAFEAQLRYGQTQRGIMGGFFTFSYPPEWNPDPHKKTLHEEIDFEAISNNFNQIQTNIYHKEPLGEGHPVSYPLSDSLMHFHTYRMEWHPDKVRWLVDSQVVRTESNRVPTKPMALHFNIWAPPEDWITGDKSLQPTSNVYDAKRFQFDVKAVKVELLPSASA